MRNKLASWCVCAIGVLISVSGLQAKKPQMPSLLTKLQWDIAHVEPSKADKKGHFKAYLRIDQNKPTPKIGDKVWVQAVGDESEHTYGKIVEIKNNIATISVKDFSQQKLKNRKWEKLRGFDAFIATPTTKAYAHRSCKYSKLPNRKGVSCETLKYVISDGQGNNILMRFEYYLKGSFDRNTGIFGGDYKGSLTYFKKGKEWVLLQQVPN